MTLPRTLRTSGTWGSRDEGAFGTLDDDRCLAAVDHGQRLGGPDLSLADDQPRRADLERERRRLELVGVDMAGRLLGLAEPGSSGRGEVGFAAAATGSSAPLTAGAPSDRGAANPLEHRASHRIGVRTCTPSYRHRREHLPPRHGRHPRWQRWGTRAPNARPKMVRPYRVVAM